MDQERLKFIERFDRFYQVLVNAIKEDKITEQDFYMILRAKCKAMSRRIKI